MAQVTGKINHFGLQMIQGRELVLRFVPSNGAVGNQTLVTPGWIVEVSPGPDGAFGVNLAATDNLRPGFTHYRIEALWFNPAIGGTSYPHVDELPFKLHVPSSGGEIGDMLRSGQEGREYYWGDDDPTLVGPVPLGAWWIRDDGSVMVMAIGGWAPQGQLGVFEVANVPKEQYIGNNLGIGRINWPGPVWFYGTAAAGFPVNARDGDKYWYVAESAEEVVISHNFSNKPDGPAGTTDTGSKTWFGGGAAGSTASIVSGELRVTGHSSGTGAALLNTGVADCIVRWRVANPGDTRIGVVLWRALDMDNGLGIAMRTSSTDSTARIVSYTGGSATVIASLGVTINAGDLVMVRSRGTFHEVRVNDVTRWAGDIGANVAGTVTGIRTVSSDKTLGLTSYHTALVA